MLNRGECQFVFVDTPGLHKARTRLGDYMVNVVKESVADVDAVLLLVEPIPNVGTPEQQLIDRIKTLRCPSVLAVNKTDTLPKRKPSWKSSPLTAPSMTSPPSFRSPPAPGRASPNCWTSWKASSLPARNCSPTVWPPISRNAR